MKTYTEKVKGSDLRIGDTIKVWWKPNRDTIIQFDEHSNPNGIFKNGARVAQFAILKPGMTIDNDAYFDVIFRANYGNG